MPAAAAAVPAGEEITQSYFPLPWPLGERQQRCREDYGFECTCPRCKVRPVRRPGSGSGVARGAARGVAAVAGSACPGGKQGQGSGLYFSCFWLATMEGLQASFVLQDGWAGLLHCGTHLGASAAAPFNSCKQAIAPLCRSGATYILPLSWPLQEEAIWSEEESEWETDDDAGMEDAEAAGGGAGGSACAHAHADGAQQQGQQGAAGPAAAGQEGQQQQHADPAYINLFLLKYVCPREGCYGTLAPLPGQPAGQPDGPLFECNMCGGRRSEAEFLAELEAAD